MAFIGSQFRNQALYVSMMHKAGMQQKLFRLRFPWLRKWAEDGNRRRRLLWVLQCSRKCWVESRNPPSRLVFNWVNAAVFLRKSANHRLDQGRSIWTEILRVNHDHPFPVHVNISQSAVQRFGEESAFL